MENKNNLTQKQQYLQHLLPKLNDMQVDKMIAVALEKKKALIEKGSESENDPYTELMSMIGCKNAKKQLTAMIADYRMRKIAEARGRKHVRAYYHAVFSGNPGCAKTTCARLYAKALANEGITKTARFAELSRSSIVGQYVGATAPKVREIFRQNAGGVILIDEAYALCDGDHNSSNNYGEEAINEIIVCLENFPETVVIFAGYPDRMEEFLASNPGLCSRIPYRVAFEDYTVEELVAISKVIAGEQGYTISSSAAEKLSEIYREARMQKGFGNGRYVRNVIEAAVRVKGINLGVMKNQDMSKFMNCDLYTDDVLFSLDESCFVTEREPLPVHHHKIGFCM